MKPPAKLGKGAARLLGRLAGAAGGRAPSARESAAAELIAADLAVARGDMIEITAAGRAYLRRRETARAGIDPFLGQHLALARRPAEAGEAPVIVDEAESPLAWLARRKGRDGRPLIEPDQLLAGERLRADFTRAHLMPRITSNWEAAVSQDARVARGGRAAHATEVVVAARQRVRAALEAVGPEFAGLLLDVCCFLKGLEQAERERSWPPRSGKIVLQLALDRLARHYGLSARARGPARGEIAAWLAPDARFAVGERGPPEW